MKKANHLFTVLALVFVVLFATNVVAKPATYTCVPVVGIPSDDPTVPADCAVRLGGATGPDAWSAASSCCDKLGDACERAKCKLALWVPLCRKTTGSGKADYDRMVIDVRACSCGTGSCGTTKLPAKPTAPPAAGSIVGGPATPPTAPAAPAAPVVRTVTKTVAGTPSTTNFGTVEVLGLVRVTPQDKDGAYKPTLPAPTDPAASRGSYPPAAEASTLPATLLESCADGDFEISGSSGVNGNGGTVKCDRSRAVVGTAKANAEAEGFKAQAAEASARAKAWEAYYATRTPPVPLVAPVAPTAPEAKTWWPSWASGLAAATVVGAGVETGLYFGGSSPRSQAIGTSLTALSAFATGYLIDVAVRD